MVVKLNYKILSGVLLMLMLVLLLPLSITNKDIPTDITVSSEKEVVYLPIIMYHEVKPFKTGKDVITPEEFENDLKYLAKNGYTTITMTELIDYVYNEDELCAKPIILSFDDGYLNNYKYVLPLLKKYHAKIVLSIIGKNTDDFTRILDNNLDYSHVTWDQLNEMIDSGHVEVQNHTYNLHSLTTNRQGCKEMPGESLWHYEQAMTEDIGKFQEQITLMTGETPNTFAYPYGRKSKNTDLVLKKLGFKATLSCLYGMNLITHDPEDLFGLRRICRSHGQNMGKVIAGGMETLKYRKT
ncbi:polysaccharide deacetylase family protein [Oscillospiraceae bacterium PP1C4]